jgi:hypothetical protein
VRISGRSIPCHMSHEPFGMHAIYNGENREVRTCIYGLNMADRD